MNNQSSKKLTIFVDHLASRGEAIALQFDNEPSVSYLELAGCVNNFQKKMGQNRCLILLEAGLSKESIVAYLAALKGRHPIILASTEHQVSNKSIAKKFGVNLIIESDGTIKKNNLTKRTIGNHLHPSLAVLLSTSGSTGGSKLVRLSFDNIEANASSIATYLQIVPDDIGAITLPLNYSYGLSILNSHLLVGARLCITQQPISNSLFLDWLEATACTNISGVPFSYEIFERIGFRDRKFSKLRFMTVAGGKLEPDLVVKYADYLKNYGGEFFVMYGQTEATARISYLPPESANEYPDCIGIAIPKGKICLFDETGSRINVNYTTGELVYSGPNVMMGYANDVKDLKQGNELSELLTGDLAERVDAGFFRILDRKTRFSKISGLRISHDDIEKKLNAASISAVVTGNDKYLAIAVMDETEFLSVVHKIMQSSSLKFSQIRVFKTHKLPRLNNGKIDYSKIKICAKELSNDDAIKSNTGSVINAYSMAFWPQDITPSDSFHSLGGDSLTYVGLSVELEKIIGSLPSEWEKSRVSELANKAPEFKNLSIIDPTVYIRAIAIFTIVNGHFGTFSIWGGASVLMVLVGYSLARFQSPSLFKGKLKEVILPFIRNMSLYYIVLIIWLIFDGTFRWQSLFLISNIIASPYSWNPIAYNSFWFIEAYAQIITIVLLMFALPTIRSKIATKPFRFGIITFIFSIVFFFIGRLTWEYSWNTCANGPCSPITEVLFFAAMGWCIHFSKTFADKLILVTVIASVAFAMNISSWPISTNIFLLVTICVLVLQIRLALPRLLIKPLNLLAASSYTIYLVHLIPHFLLIHYGASANGTIQVILGIGLGIIYTIVQKRVEYLSRKF